MVPGPILLSSGDILFLIFISGTVYCNVLHVHTYIFMFLIIMYMLLALCIHTCMYCLFHFTQVSVLWLFSIYILHRIFPWNIMLPLLFSTGMPDFAQVYSFIGSVFDPNTSGHLEKLKEMDPINVETVRLLLNLNHFHSVRVFSDSFFLYLNHAFCWIFVYLMGGSTILSKASTQYDQVFFSLEHFFIARK